jgi:hypothetical protein
MITKLFDIQPQIVTHSPEPNLKDIVFEYYAEHFDVQHSASLTKEYFDQLLFQYSQLGENDDI